MHTFYQFVLIDQAKIHVPGPLMDPERAIGLMKEKRLESLGQLCPRYKLAAFGGACSDLGWVSQKQALRQGCIGN